MDVILNLPPDLYNLAQQLAEEKDQHLETLLLAQIQHALHNPFITLAFDEQNELHALTYLIHLEQRLSEIRLAYHEHDSEP